MAKSANRMIALNKLVKSAKNVRTTPASAQDDLELYASLRHQGLKQNLVAYEGADGLFQVTAGGRRLAQLHKLVEDGHLKADHKVSCHIEDEATAEESSIVENMMRAAMHPADEFLAIADLIEKGWLADDIATRFGTTVAHVKKRLKLAAVAPAIIEAYRAGDLTLECVMAFTLSDDQARQVEVWNSLSKSYCQVSPHSIKSQLSEQSYTGSSRYAVFIGVDAYREAGGKVLEDLFSENDHTYLTDRSLVDKLVTEKLEAAAAELARTWKWAEARLQLSYEETRNYGRVYPAQLEMSDEDQAELDALHEKLQSFEDKHDTDEWTEALEDELSKAEERIEELEEAQRQNVAFTPDQQAIGGCLVSIDFDGSVKVERGLMRPEDAPNPADTINEPTDETPAPAVDVSWPHVASRSVVSEEDRVKATRKSEGISEALAMDLRALRHQVLQAHLAADFETAFDAMLYSMCKEALQTGYSYSAQTVCVSLTPAYTHASRDVLKETVAAEMLSALEEKLAIGWMKLPSPCDFEAMSALPAEDKQALFAWCTTTALQQQLSTDSRTSPVLETIGQRMNVDVAAC